MHIYVHKCTSVKQKKLLMSCGNYKKAKSGSDAVKVLIRSFMFSFKVTEYNILLRVSKY